MKRTQLTGEEILKAEQAADARRKHRAGGFRLMKDRDAGSHRLSNGVLMNWHTPKPEGENWIWRYIPEDSFELEVDGKRILFDTEEFKKWLRWT